MTIAFSGTEFDEADGVDAVIGAASHAGIDAVEMWYPKNYHRDGVAGATTRLADAGMSTVCVSTPTSLYGARREESTVLLQEALELASAQGIGLVNTYFGNAPLVDDAAAIIAYADAVRPIVRRAELQGVTLVLENEFDAFGWDPAGSDLTRRPAALAELCDRIGSGAFGLTFDAANFRCAGVDPLSEAFPLVAAHIRYVHVKDVIALPESGAASDWRQYSDHGSLYQTVRLGEGDVGWAGIVAGLARHGYSGHYTLEPHSSRRRLSEETLHARHLMERLIDQVDR